MLTSAFNAWGEKEGEKAFFFEKNKRTTNDPEKDDLLNAESFKSIE